MARKFSHEITKQLVSLHSKHGYSYDQYFRWMVEDCLAGFGIPLPQIPPEETHPILFDLGKLYAEAVYSTHPFDDVLGNVYMELVSSYGQKVLAQYFTPWPVALMLSKMVNGNELPEGNRLVRLCDPACGSGVMGLAYAHNALDTHGPDVFTRLSFTGIDIDNLCAKIFALQFLGNAFIHQIELGELLVYHGNALGDLKELNVVAHLTSKNIAPEEYLPAKDERREPMIQQVAQQAAEQLVLF